MGYERGAKDSVLRTGIFRLLLVILLAMIAACFAYTGTSDARAHEKIKLPTGGVSYPDVEIQDVEGRDKSSGKSDRRLGEPSDTVYNDLASAENALRMVMVLRDDSEVKFGNVFTPDQVHDGAMSHTKRGIEGDYLKWQKGKTRLGFSGYYNYIKVLNYYTSLNQEKTMNEEVTKALSNLEIGSKSTDYDKLKAIYDWICSNVEYDYDHLDNSNYKLQFTAYAALVNKTAVCQGYANLLYRMLLESGVDCRMITCTEYTGGEGGNHAWNIVKINGKWYNVDCTWDATIKQREYQYQYFLKSGSSFDTDHKRDYEYSTDEFNAEYPMSQADWQTGDDEGCSHSYSLSKTVSDCDEIGYKCYKCSKCSNEYETGFTYPSAHDFSAYRKHDDEKHIKVCRKCGEETEGLYDHVWDSVAVTKKPTTTETGIRTYTCSDCKATKAETIQKLRDNSNGSNDTKPNNNSGNVPSADKPDQNNTGSNKGGVSNKPATGNNSNGSVSGNNVNKPATGNNGNAGNGGSGKSNNAVKDLNDKLSKNQPAAVTSEQLDLMETDPSIPRVSKKAIKTRAKIGKGKMTIIIKKVPGAENYLVAYNTMKKAGAKAAGWKFFTTGKKTSYVIKGLKKGSLLQFKATAIRGGKRGKWSDVSYRWMAQAKGKITSGKGKVKLVIAKVKGASGYDVMYSANKKMKGQKTIRVSRTKKPKAVIRGLKKGKTCYIKYRPFRKSGGKKYEGVIKNGKIKVK